jgi:hypothetical protein
MEKGDEFFYKIIEVLHHENILEQLLLAGGWCQRLYRHYYENPREISALRTADIDFIIKKPIKPTKKSNIKEILNRIGFEEEFSFPQGYIKYTHPDLEIEFLVSEIGRGSNKPFPVKHLNTNAQRLRYLDLLEKYTFKINFYGIKIEIPQPAAFVINKFIISMRRKDNAKKQKDIITATELGEYILKDEKQSALIQEIYNNLSSNLQNKIIKTIKQNSKSIYNHLA